jgi:hypothetical protein
MGVIPTCARIAAYVKSHRHIGSGVAFGALAIALFTLANGPSDAQTASPLAQPLRLSFVPHAAFFSLHAKQSELIDPEVFVSAEGAPPATSFEQIAHAAGIRNALMSDDGTQAARDANGRKLGVDLQHWFSATGLIAFSPPATPGAGVTVSARFTSLVPRGRYSLFHVHIDRSGAAPAPLDGSGSANSFSAGADGNADVSLTVPRMLPHGEIVVLIFHGDGRDHGLQTGAPGIDAEHQMVLQIP